MLSACEGARGQWGWTCRNQATPCDNENVDGPSACQGATQAAKDAFCNGIQSGAICGSNNFCEQRNNNDNSDNNDNNDNNGGQDAPSPQQPCVGVSFDLVMAVKEGKEPSSVNPACVACLNKENNNGCGIIVPPTGDHNGDGMHDDDASTNDFMNNNTDSMHDESSDAFMKNQTDSMRL
jgi:hypothetical protein